MKRIIGLILLGIMCYYGVRYYQHMNSGEIEISPELVVIVDDWKETMISNDLPISPFRRIRKIIIVDDYVVDFDAGYCNKPKQIIYIARSTVNKGYWSTKAAVWHELGHFIFELNHEDELSIMSTYILHENIYKIKWQELEKRYINECKIHEETARY